MTVKASAKIGGESIPRSIVHTYDMENQVFGVN